MIDILNTSDGNHSDEEKREDLIYSFDSKKEDRDERKKKFFMGTAVVLGISLIAIVLGLLVGSENISAASHPMYKVFNSEL